MLDKEIREPLFDFLEEFYGKIRIFEEKITGLSRTELALLQEWNGMPEYKWQSKAFVREKILERIPEETLKHQITGLLFERDYEELLAQIREVQKTTRPRRRNMSEQRRTIKAVRKKRSAAKKRAGS